MASRTCSSATSCASPRTPPSTSCAVAASCRCPDDDRPLEAPVTVATPDPLLREVIALCFDKLPTQPSVALRARLQCEGADSDAILAERCQMKPNTFLQNVGRARKLLLECLEGRGVDLAFLGATP